MKGSNVMRHSFLILVAMCCVSFFLPGMRGALAAESAKQGKPLEITADESLEWNRNEKYFKARKNVIAVQGQTALRAELLTALYAETGWVGQHLVGLGLQVAYTPIGIVLALVFVGLPFTVRTVQPVLEQLQREHEEAAATLGASRWRTAFKVLLPQLWPALLTGFTLAFARGMGEYGSVIFIAGNLPKVSEIAPLLIVIKLEEFDYPGAMAIAVLMLLIAFATLFVLNLLHRRLSRALGQ